MKIPEDKSRRELRAAFYDASLITRLLALIQ
jgi:hypothetical protein